MCTVAPPFLCKALRPLPYRLLHSGGASWFIWLSVLQGKTQSKWGSQAQAMTKAKSISVIEGGGLSVRELYKGLER